MKPLQSLFLNFLHNDWASLCLYGPAQAIFSIKDLLVLYLLFKAHLQVSRVNYILDISLVSLVMQHTHYLVPTFCLRCLSSLNDRNLAWLVCWLSQATPSAMLRRGGAWPGWA